MTDVALNSVLNLDFIQLSKIDQQSSVASRIGLMIHKGVLLDMAKMLTNLVMGINTPTHQVALHNTETEALNWAFKGIEEELGLL
jgi:hypothetical protein